MQTLAGHHYLGPSLSGVNEGTPPLERSYSGLALTPSMRPRVVPNVPNYLEAREPLIYRHKMEGRDVGLLASMAREFPTLKLNATDRTENCKLCVKSGDCKRITPDF